MSLRSKTIPIIAKLRGFGPLCPWRAALQFADPRGWRTKPPALDIEILTEKENIHLFRFAGKHDFWFPKTMKISPELWSEYLVAFWDHPLNYHQYNRREVTIFSGDTVVDCGACEGFFTRMALSKGARKVICVEPSTVMAECLFATFENEIKEGRVVLARVALGSFSGNARFANADHDAFIGHFDSGGDETVEVVTLAELALVHGSLSFIKMDLEGSEYQTLVGGIEYLKSEKPKLAITTYHNSWDHAAVSSVLKGIGYSTVRPYGVTMRESNTPRPVMIHAR